MVTPNIFKATAVANKYERLLIQQRLRHSREVRNSFKLMPYIKHEAAHAKLAVRASKEIQRALVND